MVVDRNADGVPTMVILKKPSDFHMHFRDRALLKIVAPMVARRFRAAIAMPNLDPPVTTTEQLRQYEEEICQAAGRKFDPLMTLYLTDQLEPAVVQKALNIRLAIGIKYYPPGLTTNSAKGVQDPTSLWDTGSKPYECLQALAEGGGVLMIHAADGVAREAVRLEKREYQGGEELDPYDQEEHFIKFTLPYIRAAHPALKISVEHLSTKWGAVYLMLNGGDTLGCSITMHHLTKDRRDVFRGGFHPDIHWWPIIQSGEHRTALRALAIADKPFVWLGSDSAPHLVGKKYAECCVGGVLTAHIGIEGYVEAFEDMGALDSRLERFASINGRKFFDVDRFYGLPPNGEEIVLVRESWKVEQPFYCLEESDHRWPPADETRVIPFRLGENIRWKLASQ